MRRIFVNDLTPGDMELPPEQGHHLAHVLRMVRGQEFAVFDAAGTTGIARIISIHGKRVLVNVETIQPPALSVVDLTMASAVPKAGRADWMVEKLSELGVKRFIPLITEHSLMIPEGRNKTRRWQRVAERSAEQAHRPGLMTIDLPTKLEDLLAKKEADRPMVFLSLRPGAGPLVSLPAVSGAKLMLMAGPEGGWTGLEEDTIARAGGVSSKLTQTVLRVETAAVAAAAIAICRMEPTA